LIKTITERGGETSGLSPHFGKDSHLGRVNLKKTGEGKKREIEGKIERFQTGGKKPNDAWKAFMVLERRLYHKSAKQPSEKGSSRIRGCARKTRKAPEGEQCCSPKEKRGSKNGELWEVQQKNQEKTTS